jgi:hypothetical protein
MMNDNDKIDDILRNAAQDYNRPPSIVPRDEMWAAIEAAQAERAVRPLRIVSSPPRRPIQRYAWLGMAAAAVLLIATGVGIGRWSTLSIPASGTSAAPKQVATAPAPIAPSVEPSTEPTTEQTPAVAGEQAGPVRNLSAVRNGSSRNPQVGSARSPQLRSPAAVGSTGPYTGGNRTELPYQVATIRHLSNAEALLTAFRTDSRDAKMDAQLSVWARDLLSNTRLLLDSPAADDPQRARLLGDLELVLAEIVQLSPGATAQDRGLIEGSIRNGQVMTRLRSAIPAGPTRGL